MTLTMRRRLVRASGVGLFLCIHASALGAQVIPKEEYEARRSALMDRLPDGIVLLHANPAAKAMEQPAWIQDASFLYFTGLVNQPGAILAVDGVRRESHIFGAPAPESFGFPVDGLVLAPGRLAAANLRVNSVQRWEDFEPYLRSRIDEGTARLYVDEARRPVSPGNPAGMSRINGVPAMWRASLAQTFPHAEIRSARETITTLRWVKSVREIAILDSNAQMTAQALGAGIRRIRPGITQRRVEAAVVAGCLEAGAEGPSFWPWTMSGPNAKVDQLVRAFYDYRHLNRTMLTGELVRVDVGCMGNGYGGDVGRTVPVSGTFTPEQAETWNLLIAAYRSGMKAMRHGVTIAEIMAAARAEIELRAPVLRTAYAREAATDLLAAGGMALWSIHGVGIESGETALDTLRAGSVIAFEPMFAHGPDAYYLEDMIVITTTGMRVLSAGLPYSAEEVEAAMRRR